MSKKLFGTDGIRGVAGEYPLDPLTVHATGMALGAWAKGHNLPSESATPQVVIGMDTRESGEWIARQLAGGLAREGVEARLAGVITTPGVAHLAKHGPFVAGVMISASHNPFEDNGIKVFGHSGYKLADSAESVMEDEILRIRATGVEPYEKPMTVEPSLDEAYLHSLEQSVGGRLDGLSVVVDCGNGAASVLAPALLERLGARVQTTGCEPNGRNINLGCGALHVDGLARKVVEAGADAGFAFDGDADRCIAVSASGRIIDGDSIMLLAARHLKRRGELPGDVVVATVMSNLGLQRALEAEEIKLLRTSVGDKYVLEEMVRQGAAIGGEQSGHVIFLSQATTGDGLLTALRVLDAMRSAGQSLDELTRGLEVYPQKLVNVRVKVRRPLSELHSVNEAIREVEQALGDDGRVLVRFSGTEPLARVMVEGPTVERVDQYAQHIAGAIQAELGS